MNGKSKCKILKQIRQQIADENDIPYVTSECKYQGDCAGTCPKCEAELFFLEQELEKRRRTGKKVVLAGIAAATVVGLACCAAENTDDASVTHGGAPPASSIQEETDDTSASLEMGEVPESTDRIELEGDIALPPEDGEDETLPTLMGEPAYPPEDEPDDEPELDEDEPDDEPEVDENEPDDEPELDEDELAGVPVEDPFYEKEPEIDTGDWGPLH